MFDVYINEKRELLVVTCGSKPLNSSPSSEMAKKKKASKKG